MSALFKLRFAHSISSSIWSRLPPRFLSYSTFSIMGTENSCNHCDTFLDSATLSTSCTTALHKQMQNKQGEEGQDHEFESVDKDAMHEPTYFEDRVKFPDAKEVVMNSYPHKSSAMRPQNPSLSSSVSSFRIVIVGDIHEDWELEHDFKAIQFLQPNLVLFTGDFGNENVELVRGIAGLDLPKAAILGNHDSWSTCKFSKKIKDGVQIQLECLGEQDVGYNHLDFPALKLSVVGGRPFSCGGDKLFRKKLLAARYGVRSMEESAHKIHKAAVGIPEEHSIIFLSHNGPTGLGSNVDDICGKDWDTEGGDYGDPDLAQAISLTKDTTNYNIPLVVFGHMHNKLANGGHRKMIAIDGDNTMYLNAAVVPRVKFSSCGGLVRAFTVVEFSDGKIAKVAETWVSVTDTKTTVDEEQLLFSSDSEGAISL